jgi:hypothetical protein
MMAVAPKNTGAKGVGTKVRVDQKPTLAEAHGERIESTSEAGAGCGKTRSS